MEDLNLPDTIPNPLLLNFQENPDGTFDIEWDENDPAAEAIGCNTWTEQQWIAFLELCARDDGLEYVTDAGDE